MIHEPIHPPHRLFDSFCSHFAASGLVNLVELNADRTAVTDEGCQVIQSMCSKHNTIFKTTCRWSQQLPLDIRFWWVRVKMIKWLEKYFLY